MALAALSGDEQLANEQCIIFSQLSCATHTLDTACPAVTLAGIAVAFTLQVRV
jgi:hypothetical protein